MQTLAVFEALWVGDIWRYGYDLSRQTGLKSGTLYPILMRLAEQGFLETVWQEPEAGGRLRRHMYKLTPGGRTAALEAMSRPIVVRMQLTGETPS